MPNPVKYKSVSVSIAAYDKLVKIADHEDRAIGRQLSRMIDESYDDVQSKVASRYERRNSVGGIASVLED
jgi:hypothetical protein